jgi:hypothetical protein
MKAGFTPVTEHDANEGRKQREVSRMKAIVRCHCH